MRDPSLTIHESNYEIPAVHESIGHLGELRPEAADVILSIVRGSLLMLGVRQQILAHRKKGAQLSLEEKRRAAISVRAFYSHEAYADLTEKGQLDPMWAHERAVIRANMSIHRARDLRRAVEHFCTHFVIHVVSDPCITCNRIKGSIVGVEGVPILPPHDCRGIYCNLRMRATKKNSEKIDLD